MTVCNLLMFRMFMKRTYLNTKVYGSYKLYVKFYWHSKNKLTRFARLFNERKFSLSQISQLLAKRLWIVNHQSKTNTNKGALRFTYKLPCLANTHTHVRTHSTKCVWLWVFQWNYEQIIVIICDKLKAISTAVL